MNQKTPLEKARLWHVCGERLVIVILYRATVSRHLSLFCIHICESLTYTEHAASLVYLVTLPGRFVVVGHCAMLRQPRLSHFVQS